MTTTATVKRSFFDAMIAEPIELAISQPHQALISSASVYLVAAEASMLIAWPWNVLMAIGAEWAYLKGLSSGQAVKTPWAARLNWSAVLLVVLYGSLWGLRKFGVPLPSEGYATTDPWAIAGAIALTFVHILSIGAVTLCSAMVHRALLDAEHSRANRLQDARDAMVLEREQKEQDLLLWQKAQEVKRALKGGAPAATRPPCPTCGGQLDGNDYALLRSAQARGARFGGCKACRGKT